MNGTDKLAVNVYGNSGYEHAYQPILYSFPRDLNHIKALINWIYQTNHLPQVQAHRRGISRIMPVYGHRFMLIDVPGNPVLSMYGEDILYWADNLSKLLANELFNHIRDVSIYESNPAAAPHIDFWLEGS